MKNRLIFLVCSLIIVTLAGVYVYVNWGNMALVVDEDNELFVDNILNYMVKIPKEYYISLEDKDRIDDVVQVSSEGKVFNLYKHKLISEVTPLLLLKDDEEDILKRVFMSISFKGLDKSNKDIDLNILLEDEVNSFLEILESKEHKDIVLVAKNILDTNNFLGFKFVFKVSVENEHGEQGDVYYTVVGKCLDSNLATVVHGSLFEDKSAVDNNIWLLNNIKVLTTSMTPSQVQQEKTNKK